MTTDTQMDSPSRQRQWAEWLRKYRTRIAVVAVFLFLILASLSGLDSSEWFATIMQGLSVGALTFLVASGLSLIFGLMDVLSLAHGEIFMLGAYAGWTVYTRFDTFLDVAIPLLLLLAPFMLLPWWRRLALTVRGLSSSSHFLLWLAAITAVVVGSIAVIGAGGDAAETAEEAAGSTTGLIALVIVVGVILVGAAVLAWRRLGTVGQGDGRASRLTAWSLFVLGLGTVLLSITRFPLVIWDAEDFSKSPTNFSVQIDLGLLQPLSPDQFTWPAVLAIGVLLIGGSLIALALMTLSKPSGDLAPLETGNIVGFGAMVATPAVLLVVKEPLNEFMFGVSTTWRFVLALVIATGIGAAVGAFIEVVLIRPLYDRPIYQLMITLGVGFILIELVREVWGRPEFTMARPEVFAGTGEGCPAEGFGGFFSGCSTVEILGGRLRVYNEGFIVLMGLAVLIGVTLLLQRTRIGMVIRAGVQDPEMVEALGINVRRVFTTVFALGSGLAAFGGVLAAPSIGLSTGMGALFLLGAIVALAIGGLTSFPGAAAGALLVGLLQQLIIRFGQAGINLPFLDEPFKPTPTLVPAISILVMVIILLVLPTGLFGRTER